MKRILSLLLGLTIFAGICGCSISDGPSSTSMVPSASPSTSSTAPSSISPDGAVQENPAVFVVRGISNRESKTDNTLVKEEIEKRSGIRFDTIVVPESNYNEKVNALIASSETMDYINITPGPIAGNWVKMFEKKAIGPLDDALEKYAPDLMEMIPEEAWLSCRNADGVTYAVPRHELFPKGHTPMIRDDWYEALGMSAPTTLEELETFFEKVRTTDLNGNGIADEIPYVPHYDSYITAFRPYFCGFSGDHYLDTDGTVKPWYMHENVYDMLLKGQEWYTKGYMYPEYLTLTYEQFLDIASADRIACYTGWYNNGVRASKVTRDNNPNSRSHWLPLANMKNAPSGDSSWRQNPDYMAELVLSVTSKETEAATRLLNWMYAENENYMLVTYGIEGEHWKYAEDKKSFIYLPDADNRYLMHYQMIDWFDYSRYTPPMIDPNDYINFEMSEARRHINEDVVCTPAWDYYVPYSMTGTPAEMLTNDAETLISEAVSKVIFGQYTQADWQKAVEQAWETDGKIRSQVWTEQYAPYAK